MQLQIADVPRCARNYTQALGPKNLEPPDVAVGSMSPNWASVKCEILLPPHFYTIGRADISHAVVNLLAIYRASMIAALHLHHFFSRLVF